MVGVVMAVVPFRAPTRDEGREGTDGRSAARPRVRRSRRGVPERRWRRGPTASRPTRTRARESAGGALREGAQRQRSWRAHNRPRAPGVLWQASRFALDVGLRMAPKRERRPGVLLWKPRRLTVAVETAGIEPASAIAHEVAATSVSGALFSSRSRLAGGVLRDQPPEDVPGLAEADRPGLSRHLMQAIPAAGRRGPTAHGLASG